MVSKLHLIYGLVISTLIIVFLSVLFFSSEELNTDLAFGATLLSIIIGALAIFMTAYQGITQSTMMSKLKDSAERVDVSTKELQSIDINKIAANVTDVKVNQENLLPQMELMLSGIQSNNDKTLKVENVMNIVEGNIILENFVGALLHAYENGKKFNEYEYIIFLKNKLWKNRSGPVSDQKNVLLGSLVVFFRVLYSTKDVEIELIKNTEIQEFPSALYIIKNMPSDYKYLKQVAHRDSLNNEYYEDRYDKVFVNLQ
ncbi:hypothetical protein [Halobacillus sp. K22]|uniref:hypothetical protein n=1 Tax=Halobacillus sp. K22 TaxID=3457431 RepID=UPI003FCD9FEE